jgi:hypothetical protein
MSLSSGLLWHQGHGGAGLHHQRALALAGVQARPLEGGVTWAGLWRIARELDMNA